MHAVVRVAVLVVSDYFATPGTTSPSPPTPVATGPLRLLGASPATTAKTLRLSQKSKNMASVREESNPEESFSERAHTFSSITSCDIQLRQRSTV